MNRSPLPLAALLASFAAGPLLAQDGALPPSTHDALDRFAAVQREDGRLIGAGRDYRVRFDAAGMEFTPALGRTAPELYPLRLDMTASGRGALRSPASAVEPREDGLTVRYARGQVVETYEVRPQGVEQSFVFEALPDGKGDLGVTLRVDTALPLVHADDDELRFANAYGGVRIAGVVGIDARGVRRAGSLACSGGVLELRLPADFVEKAALPLVLDPLIETFFTVASGSQDHEPAVAYDADSFKYLVVWNRDFSASSSDIMGQLLRHVRNPAGEFFQGSIIIRTSVGISRRPRVADQGLRNQFLVAWEESTSAAPTNRDIYARTVPPDSAIAMGATASLASGANDQRGVELASEISERFGTVMLAYLDGSDVKAMRANVSGTNVVSVFSSATVAAGESASVVRLPKVGGYRGETAPRYLVAWVASGAVRYRVMDFDHTFRTAAASLPGVTLAVDAAVDGDGRSWTLAYAQREAASGSGANVRDIWVTSFVFEAGASTLTESGRRALAATAGVEEAVPVVGCFGQGSLVAWIAVSGTARLVRAQTLTLNGCSTCEETLTVASSDFAGTRVALGTKFSGGDSSSIREDLVFAWDAQVAGVSSIAAQRFRPTDGGIAELGGGCGATAEARDECAVINEPTHRAMLRGAPVGASGWLVLSFERLDAAGCGSCVLVPSPYSGAIAGPFTADASGAMSFLVALPNESALRGLDLFEQWLIADASAPGCSTFSLDFSNALQITIE